MAACILILTVGGSCTPIVRAIQHHQPSYVYFICSTGARGSSALVDGPGDVCGDNRTCPTCKTPLGDPRGKSIVAQTGLTAEQYEKCEIADPDDLTACYRVADAAFARALARDPRARIAADYTGGTKTMTAALVRLATGRYAASTDLFVVTGYRGDLRVVRDGTEAAQSQDVGGIVLEDLAGEALRLANDYHYAAAARILERIVGHRPPPPPTLRRRAYPLLMICRGFDSWDRFAHAQAYALLQPEAALLETLESGLINTIRTLAAAATRHDAPEQGQTAAPAWGAPALLPVYDLLHNADRRAAQGRHDDAVARHYRAFELLAQNRLRAVYDIDPSAVDPGKVGAWVAAHPTIDTAPPIKIGLVLCYDVLVSLGDQLGTLWTAHRANLLNILNRRNTSILAHGLKPIGPDEYAALRDPIWAFVDRAVKETGAKLRLPGQFPRIDEARLPA